MMIRVGIERETIGMDKGKEGGFSFNVNCVFVFLTEILFSVSCPGSTDAN